MLSNCTHFLISASEQAQDLPPGPQVIKPQLRQPGASGKGWSLHFGPSSGLQGPLSKPLESAQRLYLKKLEDSIRFHPGSYSNSNKNSKGGWLFGDLLYYGMTS